MTWIQTHWPLIVALAGAVYSLLSIINGAITNPEAKGIIGKILDGLSYIARGGAPGSVKMPFTLSKKPGLQPPTAGAIIVAQSARVFLPFLLVGAMLSGCPVPGPMPTNLDGGAMSDGGTNSQKFDAALASCEESNNLAAVTSPQAQQILQILETGGFSWSAIEQKLEAIAAIGGGDELAIFGGCAAYAYMQVYPIATGKKPTPSQAAARVYLAKLHQVAPGARFGGR